MIHITNRQASEHPLRIYVFKGRQRVSGFPRLRDTHHQRIGQGHRVAIAILRSDLHLARQPCQCLNPVSGNETCVITRATGENLYGSHPRKHLCRRGPENLICHGTLSDRIAQARRLLKYLFQHEVLVIA